MAIIISQKGKDAKKIEKSDFGSEGDLQKYIYDNPESIPLYEIKEDIRLLILAREFSTNSGPIDAIGIDGDGEIYLIETKLYNNTDKRRVVAQVLDYGASLWRYSGNFSEFLGALEEDVIKKFNIGFNQKLKNFFEAEDDEISVIIESMEQNLRNGNFRFVVLMNKLHAELKDLIVFINQNSKFDIFAVELEYYRHAEYEIIIPRIFGAEVKKDISVGKRATKRWDDTSFIEYAKAKITDKKILTTLLDLYAFGKETADDIHFGTGMDAGRVAFRVKYSETEGGMIPIFRLKNTGAIKINFWIAKRISGKSGGVLEETFLKKLLTLPTVKEWYQQTSKEIAQGKKSVGNFIGRNLHIGEVFPSEKSLEIFKSAILDLKKEIKNIENYEKN